MRLWGQHSVQNYGIASYMAYRFLRGRGLTTLAAFIAQNRSLAAAFKGVPLRMERRASVPLGRQSVLHFINDSTATMPDATAAALAACLGPSPQKSLELGQRHCLLIAGGTDKQLDSRKLLSYLRAYKGLYSLFLLQGSGTQALIPQLKRADLCYFGRATQGIGGSQLAQAQGGDGFASLRPAFALACQVARAQAANYKDQYVLLAPGYASFGMFANEFERGRQFDQLVEQYQTDNMETANSADKKPK